MTTLKIAAGVFLGLLLFCGLGWFLFMRPTPESNAQRQQADEWARQADEEMKRDQERLKRNAERLRQMD